LNLTINTATQISQCHKAWDEVLPEGHHLLSRHLEAFEQSNIEDIENNYVQVFLKDELIGLIYLQQFSFRHKHLNFRTDQTLLSNLIKIILPKKLPLLVCGHLFRINFQGFYFIDSINQQYLFDVIDLFIRSSKKLRPCGIMIKDCNDVIIEQRCRLSGYHFFNGDVTMELTRRPHWLSFDDYLKDLKKNYLQRARKVLQAFEVVEIKEFCSNEIEQHASEIEQLYWNVVNKQTVKLGTINAGYFCELKKDLGENFEFHALYKEDKMVGFYSFIFYAHEMETHYIGLDYEANKTAKIYFNILFLGIRKMIERRDIKLELGRTAKEAKANLGAIPRQVFNYIKISNPLVRITLNYFLKRFNNIESKAMINRNPLK